MAIFMKFIMVLWLFLLVHIYYSTVEDKVFVHDRLCYEVVSSGREISFHYIPSELNSYSAVNFAIWRPRENESPLWYAAENRDSDWELNWQWNPDGTDGDYAVHVYGICRDKKYRKLSEDKFTIRDSVIQY